MNLDLPNGLTADKSTWSGTPEEDLQILRELGGVDTGGKSGYKIVVSDADTEWNGQGAEFKEQGEVARIEYYHFAASNAGYIGWIEVAEAHRGRGVALTIRTAAMKHLLGLGSEAIYTGQLSEGGRALATKHGFRPLDEGNLAGEFYVYRR